MLENYCRINVTTENVPQIHLCLLQEELKLQTIVSKVDKFREKWMGKDNINRQQRLSMWNVRYLALILNKKATSCHQNSRRVEFFHDVAFPKGRLKLILQLLKKRLFQRNKAKVSRFDMLFVQIWWGFLVVCPISISEPQNVKVVIKTQWYLSFLKVHMTRNFLLTYSKELSKWWKMAFIVLG